MNPQAPHRSSVTAPPDALIQAHAVTLRLGGRVILEHIDLSLQAGRIITLIGPNGAGKTSLLRVLLGLLAPSAGHISRAPRLRIGYMPQRIVIDPVLPITVRRFLSLAGRVQPAQLAAALEETGVGYLLNQPIQSVSGGEMQRILLARALLRRPQLLVLDEPAQGVDVGRQGEVFALIEQLRQRYHCGVLMVSHELHWVMAAADEVICLNRHICCTGQPQAVSRHPEYLKLFGEQLPFGVAPYRHQHDHAHDLCGNVIRQKVAATKDNLSHD